MRECYQDSFISLPLPAFLLLKDRQGSSCLPVGYQEQQQSQESKQNIGALHSHPNLLQFATKRLKKMRWRPIAFPRPGKRPFTRSSRSTLAQVTHASPTHVTCPFARPPPPKMLKAAAATASRKIGGDSGGGRGQNEALSLSLSLMGASPAQQRPWESPWI